MGDAGWQREEATSVAADELALDVEVGLALAFAPVLRRSAEPVAEAELAGEELRLVGGGRRLDRRERRSGLQITQVNWRVAAACIAAGPPASSWSTNASAVCRKPSTRGTTDERSMVIAPSWSGCLGPRDPSIRLPRTLEVPRPRP
jgi:hypothetical protein